MLHKFILEPYKGMCSRYHCPCCQHREKTFSLYIDTETGQHINSKVGRCNRETSCGYHYTPKQYFKENNISFENPLQKSSVRTLQPLPAKKATSLIPFNAFKGSLANYTENNFLNYLIELFGIDITNSLISKYYIGTSKHWQGATVFWQIDIENNIRTGKIMLYSPTTGKRIKEPFNHIHWVHKALKLPEYNLKQCFFGEHLLNDTTKPVAIVESEKTALIASVYFPQFIWVAVGSLQNLSAERCKVLKGRNVCLFPDLKAFEKWNSKAKELSHIAKFYVSDLLEKKATDEDKNQGFDIADYLIKFNVNEFIEVKPTLETFVDMWLQQNPEGGIIEAEGEKFIVRKNKIQ